jgi:hypothetical protein
MPRLLLIENEEEGESDDIGSENGADPERWQVLAPQMGMSPMRAGSTPFPALLSFKIDCNALESGGVLTAPMAGNRRDSR